MVMLLWHGRQYKRIREEEMYAFLLALHNIVRWVVVLGGLYAIITSLQGLINKGKWTVNNTRAGLIFTNALNLQFVLGLILLFISPYMRGLFGAMSEAMKVRESRFFVAEHWLTMILALLAAQLGYSLAKRAKDDRGKFVRSSLGYLVAALLMAYGIPWWRPLFPGL
jgi:hypothetical protein